MQINPKLLFALQRKSVDFHDHGAGVRCRTRQRRRFSANHQARQRSIGFFLRITYTGHLAAAQNRTGRAQLTDFMEFVADVKNAAALARQTIKHDKELFHRLRREHRGWLVKNQQLRTGQQGADDFDALHFTHAQGMHGARRVDFQTVFLALGLNGRSNRLERSPPQTEPDVLGHGHRIEQIEVLEHHADTRIASILGAADIRFHPVEHHLPGIGLDRAVDDLHQGRFAGTVLAQHGMNFARHYGQ